MPRGKKKSTDPKSEDGKEKSIEFQNKSEHELFRDRVSSLPIETFKRLCKTTLVMEECYKSISRLDYVSDSLHSKGATLKMLAEKVNKEALISSFEFVETMDQATISRILAEYDAKSVTEEKDRNSQNRC